MPMPTNPRLAHSRMTRCKQRAGSGKHARAELISGGSHEAQNHRNPSPISRPERSSYKG